MTILIIGNSHHLFEAIGLAYPDHEIKVISWRRHSHESVQSKGDLVFVVGFDYGSYTKSYADYIDANVVRPLLAVKRLTNTFAPVVYVATQTEKKTFTLSRYRYAKEKLGHELLSQMPNAYVLRFDTFATPNQEPIVKGGAISRQIFKYLAKYRIIKIVDMSTVSERIKKFSEFATQDLPIIRGFFIFFPRPQFIDRLLRLFIG